MYNINLLMFGSRIWTIPVPNVCLWDFSRPWFGPSWRLPSTSWPWSGPRLVPHVIWNTALIKFITKITRPPHSTWSSILIWRQARLKLMFIAHKIVEAVLLCLSDLSTVSINSFYREVHFPNLLLFFG